MKREYFLPYLMIVLFSTLTACDSKSLSSAKTTAKALEACVKDFVKGEACKAEENIADFNKKLGNAGECVDKIKEDSSCKIKKTLYTCDTANSDQTKHGLYERTTAKEDKGTIVTMTFKAKFEKNENSAELTVGDKKLSCDKNNDNDTIKVSSS